MNATPFVLSVSGDGLQVTHVRYEMQFCALSPPFRKCLVFAGLKVQHSSCVPTPSSSPDGLSLFFSPLFHRTLNDLRDRGANEGPRNRCNFKAAKTGQFRGVGNGLCIFE